MDAETSKDPRQMEFPFAQSGSAQQAPYVPHDGGYGSVFPPAWSLPPPSWVRPLPAPPPPPPRKIIQIAAMAVPGEGVVLAVCNDGTVWEISKSQVWTQLPAIPQDN